MLDQAKAADLKRHELEDYLTKNYARSSSNWDTDSMRNYLKQKGLIKSDAEANVAQIKELLCVGWHSWPRLMPFQHLQLRRRLEQEQRVPDLVGQAPEVVAARQRHQGRAALEPRGARPLGPFARFARLC